MNDITLHQCTAVVGIVNMQYCRAKFVIIFFLHLAALNNDGKQILRQYTKIVYLLVTCIMYYQQIPAQPLFRGHFALAPRVSSE